MLPKCKAWININLCGMISMNVVCLTIKINVLKMEQAFHSGYCKGDKVFQVFNCLFLYCCKGFFSPTPKSLFFLTKDFQFNCWKMFLLPLYAEVEAQVMTYLLSPCNIKNHVRYDYDVRVLLDDIRLWTEVDHIC